MRPASHLRQRRDPALELPAKSLQLVAERGLLRVGRLGLVGEARLELRELLLGALLTLARALEIGLEPVPAASHLRQRRDTARETLLRLRELLARVLERALGLGERLARALELALGASERLVGETELGLERDDAVAERVDLILEQCAARLELAEIGIQRRGVAAVDRQQRVVAGAGVAERAACRLVGGEERLHLGVGVREPRGTLTTRPTPGMTRSVTRLARTDWRTV